MKCSQARPATAEPWSWPRTLPPPPPPRTVGLLAQFPLPEEENITYLLPQAARDLVTALQSSRISMQGPTPAAGLYLQRDILQCLSLTLIEWARWAQRGKGTARGLWQKCIPLHRAAKTRKKSLCLPAPAQHSPWDQRDKPTRVRQSHHGDTAGDAPVQEVGRSHTPSSSSELFSLVQHDLFQTTDCVPGARSGDGTRQATTYLLRPAIKLEDGSSRCRGLFAAPSWLRVSNILLLLPLESSLKFLYGSCIQEGI